MQAKLTIGQPGDKYEQEADRMAAKVMRMPEPLRQAQGPGEVGAGLVPVQLQERLLLQREAMPDEKEEEVQMRSAVQRQVMPGEEEEETIQAKGGTPAVPGGFEGQLARHRGGGQPLSDQTRAFMEPRFGTDFGGVRVHETPDLANAIQAQAFTHGQDIYFNSGKYNPGSSGGKELLAHELTHVVQQNDEQQVKRKDGNQKRKTYWEWWRSNEGQEYQVRRKSMKRKGYKVRRLVKDSSGWKETEPQKSTLRQDVAWKVYIPIQEKWEWVNYSQVVKKFRSWSEEEIILRPSETWSGDLKKEKVADNIDKVPNKARTHYTVYDNVVDDACTSFQDHANGRLKSLKKENKDNFSDELFSAVTSLALDVILLPVPVPSAAIGKLIATSLKAFAKKKINDGLKSISKKRV